MFWDILSILCMLHGRTISLMHLCKKIISILIRICHLQIMYNTLRTTCTQECDFLKSSSSQNQHENFKSLNHEQIYQKILY